MVLLNSTKYDSITIMNTLQSDLSALFPSAENAAERMLAFGDHVTMLAERLQTGDVTVTLDDAEQVVLRQAEMPVGPRYRSRLPGVEIIDPVTGRSLGVVGSSAHGIDRLLRRGKAVAGGIHFQLPGAGFSIEADSAAFLDPETIEMHKQPFHDAVQVLGRAMLRLDQGEDSQA